MGSMHTGLEDDAKRFGDLTDYFAERARGGVGLIVTGGFAPNIEGWTKPRAGTLSTTARRRKHLPITQAVHDEGGHIALQILHTGRYAYQPLAVAPSRIKSPISPFAPRALSERGIERQIKAFVKCAALAREAGYDGVEIMGSEGYFINQFLVTHTNRRTDGWGGSYANRMRLAVEIVRRTREAVGPDFIIIYRLSMLDLIPDGSTWPEAVELARAITEAGATILNTGIGWHEARVPTIATSVPRAAFTWVTQKMRAELRADGIDIPLVTTNRINTPEVAEQALAEGAADMVSMARPLLADPDFVRKAEAGRADRINTCIACNQACLDHAFKNKTVSCLVNPRAGHEDDLVIIPAPARKRIAVVGAARPAWQQRPHSPTAATRWISSTAPTEIGGQFTMARRIPGKEEFQRDAAVLHQSDRRHRRATAPVDRRVSAADLEELGVDEVVLATGVTPRDPHIPGQDAPNVVSYIDVLAGDAPVGDRVAIVGAGGIGFDVAEFLVTAPASQRRSTSRSGPGSGACRPRRGPRRADEARPRPGRTQGDAAAAQVRQARARGWARPPAGSTARRSSPRGCRCCPGSTTSGSRPRGSSSRSGTSTSGSTWSRRTRSCCARGRNRCASSSRRWARPGCRCT